LKVLDSSTIDQKQLQEKNFDFFKRFKDVFGKSTDRIDANKQERKREREREREIVESRGLRWMTINIHVDPSRQINGHHESQ
jgi:hypothetical protein